VTDPLLPALTPTARGLLGTIVEIGRPITTSGLVVRCNPRPVTTSEAEVDRWRAREQDLRRAVAELHDAGVVARAPHTLGTRTEQVVWVP